MSDFYKKNSMSCPWTESPFFYEMLGDLAPQEKALATQFHEHGYVVIDLNDVPAEQIILSIDEKIIQDQIKTQEKGYHYSDGPRVFEAWKWNQDVLNLAKHPKLLSTLRFLYNQEPIPFQTINFKTGTNQPLHSDTIHFHSIPQKWVAAAWIALEDMDDYNGTLCYVSGSHKWPVYDFQDLKLPVAEYGKQFESYTIYEDFIARLVAKRASSIKRFYAKKGQALIWSANLIHGGAPIRDLNRTRWSQATHYYFEGCEKYYSPIFSYPFGGKYSEKDLSNKDIMNYTIHRGE